MKTIRTKGPWLFGRPFAGKYSIYGDMGGPDPSLIAAVTSLVDAQFILAAPEMHEALKSAETFEASLIDEWADFWDVAPQSLIDKLMKAQELRNAALERTEGR